ncbi:hypothetical protein [Bradyrhizobium sp.]|jgi:hypothetical protein|uniref:hypothetical protein n=1 Tax=Bradyrhizobium sp. TaxID=376 RepID=UPI002BEFC52D|nr:hypothetical protein [Bradyrhizobium sp.]HWX60727.1 hypothetical protein [Bradyrhizobium sp.]
MTRKVGGRLALMFAAGLIAYFGVPLRAALVSSVADAQTARTSWLGDTLSPSDVMNLRPIVGSKAGSTGKAKAVVVAEAQIGQGQMVTPDQLSDVDRALAGSAARATVGIAPAATRHIVRVAPIIVASPSDAWDQTSLIGKIFVGIGACLTLASALRMFVA